MKKILLIIWNEYRDYGCQYRSASGIYEYAAEPHGSN